MSPTQIEAALGAVIKSVTAKSASVDAPSMTSALLRYAEEHKLAPAQLQKMAQTYNMTHTLAHAKYAPAERRGEDLDLLDVGDILDSYTDVPQRKAANAIVHQPAEWHGFTVGKHFRQGRDSVDVKAADKWMDDNPDRVGGFKKASLQVRHQVQQAEVATLQDILFNASREVGQHLTKLARIVRMKPAAYTALSQDVATLGGPEAADAFDNFLHTQAMHPHLPKQAAVAYTDDVHGIQKTAHAIQDGLEFCAAARELIKQAGGGPGWSFADDDDRDDEYAQPPVKVRRKSKAPREEDEDELYIPPAPKKPAPSGERDAADEPIDTNAPLSPPGGPPGGPPKLNEPRMPYTEQQLKTLPFDMLRPSHPGLKSAPAGPAPESKEPHTMSELMAALTSGAALGGNALETVGNIARRAGDTLSQASPDQAAATAASRYGLLMGNGRDVAAKRTASKVEEIKHQVVLSRLLASDDIIKRMPQGMVASLFNTLRNTNPTAAADINIARIVLREALQHQGITLNTVKTLKDTNQPTPAAK